MKNHFNLIQSGTRVVIELNGQHVANLPWEAALELAKGLLTQGKKAEEWAKALQVAGDQAVLLRAGVPIGLTSHPAIQAEAAKIARDDRTLRRAMPSIKSQEQFGVPTLRRA